MATSTFSWLCVSISFQKCERRINAVEQRRSFSPQLELEVRPRAERAVISNAESAAAHRQMGSFGTLHLEKSLTAQDSLGRTRLALAADSGMDSPAAKFTGRASPRSTERILDSEITQVLLAAGPQKPIAIRKHLGLNFSLESLARFGC